jgi:isopenicillin N synthase-like dioxygenase
MPTPTAQTIPVVDLRDFQTGTPDQRLAFVQTLGQALETVGFFAVTHSGVDETLLQQAYTVAEAFFAQPDRVKLSYADPALRGQRGFTRFGQEHAKDSSAPDLKEFWHLGQGSIMANLDPSEVPEFQPTLLALYGQLMDCAGLLLEACALYLGEPQTLLRDMTVGGDTILRVIHYPTIPAGVHPHSLRAAPHEDINLITLLCAATTGGLELLQRDGSWLAIPALPGQIIVDSGDMLQWLTNGRLRSTTHRVVNGDSQGPIGDPAQSSPRFSLPFFVHPAPSTDLTPRPHSIAATGGSAKFPPITAGAYLTRRLQEIGLIAAEPIEPSK